MSTTRRCGECGNPLAADGDCPICALKRALALSGQGSEAHVIEQAGDWIGRYKLLEKIGEGGYGVVYMAEQAEPIRRRVALKIVKLGMDTWQVIARFEAERQALALMDHPNIAKVLDAGATDMGRPYFVMELVRGIKITAYCDQHNLSTKERLDLFIQVCHAVQHAHQKGIIHRDLKPSNVMVTELDGIPVPKVIDFGIAKATSQRLLTDKTLFTAFQQFIGTPAYMSPEQAGMSGADIDTRSDIYALGVLLYELVTGRVPFEKQELLQAGLDEMRRLIREKEPLKPSTRLSALSAEDLTKVAKQQRTEPPKLLHLVRGDLDWIVMKCLEKDRSRRYETANSLAHDVARHLNDEPVTARPPGAVYRFRKMARRNKLAFAAATTVALALGLGIIGSTWQAVRARRAEREARQAQQQARSEAQRAERAAAETKMALAASDFLQAVRLIAEDDSSDALAYLARSLAANPANAAALTRLVTLLSYRSWPLPATGAMTHNGQVSLEQFSSDGKRILTVSTNTVQVWDAQTGQPLSESMNHSRKMQSAQLFSPDGKWILTVSANTVQVRDAQTGEPLANSSGGVNDDWQVTSAQFSPDGKRILTIGKWTVRVWDAQTGQLLTQTMKHNYVIVASAHFSPDGKRIVTVSEDYTARVWDARTGQPLSASMNHSGKVQSAQFSPDGKWIVTASEDGTARVWDAQTSRPLSGAMNHSGKLQSAQFSPDGKRVVTGFIDNAAEVWDTQVWDVQNSEALTETVEHNSLVTVAQFSPDGKRVVTASEDQTARVWDAQTGQPLTEPMQLEQEPFSAQFSPDGKWIVTTCGSIVSSEARVWDAQTGQPLTEPLKYGDSVASAEFSPDGKRIVTSSGDHTARVWDAQTGQPLTEPMRHSSELRSVEFSPDGKRIVTDSGSLFDFFGGGASEARVWDAQTGQPLMEPLKHGDSAASAHFSPDGKRIVMGDRHAARVWDAQSGQPLTEPLKHSDTVVSAQFSPDGKRIVTASEDHTARVWDAQSGQPLMEPLKHSEAVTSAQFSPDGRRIVTASKDTTVRVWDAQSGQPLTEPLKHSEMVVSAQFSPDGKRIVTADGHGAHVWDIAPSGTGFPDWLLTLAEALSGKRLTPQGVLEASGQNPAAVIGRIRRKLEQAPGNDDWVVWGRWFLADRATRTISPFSKVTIPQYHQRQGAN